MGTAGRPRSPLRTLALLMAALGACATATTNAQTPAAAPATTQREVEALIAALGDSGCRFQRNGRWHDARTAQVHLRRKYCIKHGTRQTAANITKIDSILDINTQQRHDAEALKLNDVARIALTVQQPLAADAYSDIRATGAFILIDEVTHQTVAAGMIRLGE